MVPDSALWGLKLDKHVGKTHMPVNRAQRRLTEFLTSVAFSCYVLTIRLTAADTLFPTRDIVCFVLSLLRWIRTLCPCPRLLPVTTSFTIRQSDEWQKHAVHRLLPDRGDCPTSRFGVGTSSVSRESSGSASVTHAHSKGTFCSRNSLFCPGISG